MKKIFIILVLLLFFTLPSLALGQITNQETEEETSPQNKIDQIKDKVTDKVEQLNLVEKRGIIGVVENINDDQIRINDLNDKIRIIEVDELTKFSSEENNSFDINDIEPGVSISAIGLFNKDSEKLLVRFLNEVTIPIFLNGVISEINEDDFTVTLVTEEETNYIIDVENVTKTFTFEEEDLDQSGFSDLDILQNAIVTGFSDPDENNRITATRIIVFPDIPKNPRINLGLPEPTEEDLSPTP